MEEDPKADLPSVELANKDWVLKELMETEKRFEKAFHDQTTYLGEKHSLMEKAFHDQTIHLNERYNDMNTTIQSQTRWLGYQL